MELESKQLRPLLKKALCLFMTALMLFSSLGGTFSVFAYEEESVASEKAGVQPIYEGDALKLDVKSGQEVLFQFVPTATGMYSFYSQSAGDTYGCLYDENKNRITENDDDADYNFRINAELEEGKTYYYSAKKQDDFEDTLNVYLVRIQSECSHSDENDDFTCDECGYEFEVVTSGNCGDNSDNVIWNLYENGTLFIDGEGAMADYDYNYGGAPAPYLTYTCDEMGYYQVNDEKIKKVVIDDGVTYIGDYAFATCRGLKEAVIPGSVSIIGNNAFAFSGLKNVIIPEGVTEIRGHVFRETKIEELHLPSSLESCGSQWLLYCYSLKSITVDEDNPYYTDMDNVLFTKDMKRLIQYPIGLTNESYTVPDGVKTIGEDSFEGCSNIKEVIIPYGVKTIDMLSFQGCSELERVVIPYSVKNISWRAFDSCDSLTDIYYSGNEGYWNKIDIDSDNYSLFNATVHFNDEFEGIPEINLSLNETVTIEIDGSDNEDLYFTPAKDGTYRFVIDAEPSVMLSYVKVSDYESEDWCWENEDWFYGKSSWTVDLQGGVRYYFRAYSNDNVMLSITAECIYAECDHTDTTSYEAEEATCTQAGYTAGVKCNECTLWIEGHEKVTVPHIDDDSDNTCDVCGNSMSDIAVGETKTIDIISDEITYLKFIPSESGTYTFYSISDEDTYGYIFDETKEELSYNNNYMDNDFYVSYYLEAGETYYLGARYYNESREGSFDVSLYFGDRSELSGWDDDDDWEDDDDWGDDDWWDDIYENGYVAERVSDGNVCLIKDMTEARQKAYANGGDLVIPELFEGYYPVVGFAWDGLTDYDNDLRSITIPASVETLPYHNFIDCGFANLEEIIVDENNTTYKSIDGVLYNADVTEILAVPRAYKGVLTIPATVQNVDSIVLVGVNGIKDIVYEGEQGVVFEGNVLYNADKTRIIKAFDLKGTYEMPESVTEIEWYAFADLDELKEVKFSPNVTDITYYTFYDCDALEEVVAPTALQSIGQSAFENCDSLKTVELNEGLTEIGVRAFNSSAVEKITIPSTVTETLGSSFADCANLKEVNLGSGMTYVPNSMFSGCTALEEIIIPESITEIYWGAFEETGLKKIEIPDSVAYISADAFSDCDSMKSAVIGDGVIEMGGAFRGCDALEKVVLGKSIQYYDSAFYGCNSLKEVVFPEGFNGYGEDAFSSCENLADVSLPESVQAIAYGQFRNCNSLEEFDLPENIRRVHAHAFDDSKWYDGQEDGDIYFDDALYTYKGVMPENHELVVDEGTKLIADSAYENEYNLSFIDLPDGLKYIGNWAFENSGVKGIIVPDSLERVGYGAFYGCYDLTDVYYAGTEEQWNMIEIQDYNYHLTSGNIHFEYSRCRHENTVEVEATSTDCSVPGFTAGVLCTDCDEYISGHKAIGPDHKDDDFNGECDVCFAAAQELVYVTDGNLVYIGKGETRYLKFVPEITKMYVLSAESSRVKTIKVLNDKYELLTTLNDEYGWVRRPVELEAGETYYFAVEFDSKAFKGEFWFNIIDIYYGYEDGYDYAVRDGQVTIMNHYYDQEKELTVPDSFDNYPVVEIGYDSFINHYKVEKLEIAENVTKIVYGAFDGAHSLKEVYLPSTIESIWTGAFEDSEKITDVHYNGTMEEFKNIRVEFDNEALLNANIHCLDGDFETVFTEGDFTYRVNFMGNNGTVTVVEYNGNGGDVVIPENVRGYDVAEISSEAFINGSGITSISIPSTITRMHHSAFSFCDSIERVYITDIAKWCDIFFDYETATPLCMDADLYLNGELLTDVIIPEGVTHISNYAFYGCTSIKTVEIPESVTYIGWRTFNYCDTLSDIYYRGDEEMWNDIDFGDFNTSLENAEIHFMSGHEHSFGEEIIAPTCGCDGYTLHTCMICGYSYADNYTDALDHDYEATVTAPDCENAGYTTYTCTVCGDWYTDDYTDALGHDYTDTVTAPTCQAGGYTTHICNVCGEGYTDSFTDSIDHNYESVVTPPTCEKIGFTTHTCTMCGDVIENEGVDALGHDYKSVVTEPTCTDKGYTTHTCTRCDDSYTDNYVNATGHNMKETAAAVVATCTAAGKTAVLTCANGCGKTEGGAVVSALGHDKVSHSGKAATCTEGGWKAYVTCKRCDYTTYTTTKALGHSYPDDFNIVYDASYKTTGVKMKGCTRYGCNETKDRTVIPRLTLSKVKNLKATPDAKSIKFTWSKVIGAESYEVQYSTNGKKWTKVKATKNSATIKKLKAGTTYKVKVKAIAGSNNGAFSSVLTTSTEPVKVNVTKVTSTKSKQITVNWKKISGVTGYEVQYSTAKNFKKNTKTVTIKKQSTVKTTLKKLTKGKKYYIRVRAYKTVGKAKIVGAWSSVKNIKSK